MAIRRQSQRMAYGIINALQNLAPETIVAQRRPNINDQARPGTVWIYTQNPVTGITENEIYITPGSVDGDVQWLNLAGGTATFDAVVIDPGNLTITEGNADIAGDVVVQGNISSLTGSILAPSAQITSIDTDALQVTNSITLTAEPNGVLITDNVGLMQATNGTDGQVILGGGTAPAFGTITSAGMTIDFSAGPNSLNMERGGAAGISDFQADGPSNAQPLAGVIEFLGGSNITTSAGTNQVTFDLDNDVTISGALTAGTTLESTTTTTVGNTLTVTAGDATITAGNLVLPTTTSTAGQVTIGGNRFLHAYGTNNTFVGSNSGNFTLTAQRCVGAGQNVLTALTSGNDNVGIGANVLSTVSSTNGIVAIGSGAMQNGTAQYSVAIGRSALAADVGGGNTAIGFQAGINITSGEDNLLLGANAGSVYTTETNNICIMNAGVAADADTIRVGNNTHTSCLIGGIYSRSVGGTNAAVLVDNTGLLGTAVSSARFKENIEDMGDRSDALMKMRPVTFNYKSNPDYLAYGLIAEEVNDVMPDLVNLDDEGLPHNVKYHDLPPILLHQVQKLVHRVKELESKAANCSCRS